MRRSSSGPVSKRVTPYTEKCTLPAYSGSFVFLFFFVSIARVKAKQC